MMFQGYDQQTVDFLWGIRFNNDRSWFQDHKEQYQTHLQCINISKIGRAHV